MLISIVTDELKLDVAEAIPIIKSRGVNHVDLRSMVFGKEIELLDAGSGTVSITSGTAALNIQGGTTAFSASGTISLKSGLARVTIRYQEFRAPGLNNRGMDWGHRTLREGGGGRERAELWKFYRSGAPHGGSYYVMQDSSIETSASNTPPAGTIYSTLEGGRTHVLDDFEYAAFDADGGYTAFISPQV